MWVRDAFVTSPLTTFGNLFSSWIILTLQFLVLCLFHCHDHTQHLEEKLQIQIMFFIDFWYFWKHLKKTQTSLTHINNFPYSLFEMHFFEIKVSLRKHIMSYVISIVLCSRYNIYPNLCLAYCKIIVVHWIFSWKCGNST